MKSIFRSTPPSRRHRQTTPQTEGQAEPAQPFFQPKLAIGQPGDRYEREADAVADAVVSNPAKGQPAIQRMPISSVQRAATPDEEKMPATNDGRMAEDKKIQEKPEEGGQVQKMDAPEEEQPVQKAAEEEEPVQAKEEEEQPVQKAAEEEEPVQAKEEEEQPVQKAAEEEEPVQAKEEEEQPVQKAAEEEEPVQAKEEEEQPIQKAEEEEPVQAKEEEEAPVQKAAEEEEPVQAKEEEEAPVQAKSQSGASHASPNFSSRLSARRGQGSPLPPATRAQMEQGIGADFGHVRVHTDSEAEEMNKNIHAQAFTHGNDVYFNSGKYSPESTEGKRLLAHELTHVVQQGGGAKNELQRKDVPGTSTPVPKGYKVETADDGQVIQSTGTTGGVVVTILPDTIGETHDGADGTTTMRLTWKPPGWKSNDGAIVSELNGKTEIELIIQTIYLPDSDPTGDSAYGRGTTKKDERKGHKSVRFHEGMHGEEAILYLKKHPVPKFKWKKGMTIEQFRATSDDFDMKMYTYNAALQQSNLEKVHCVGVPHADCKK